MEKKTEMAMKEGRTINIVGAHLVPLSHLSPTDGDSDVLSICPLGP